MVQGFQRKIDTIVDSIVSSEKENNKRVDEFDIAENIKKAISDLNDVGKLLVLDDLSKEAGSKPSTLLTIDGKISIQKLNEVVVSKIKEAERDGIELRNNTPNIFSNERNKLSEQIFTVAVIDKMIENYENLTPEQRKELNEEIDRKFEETLSKLSPEQKEKYKGTIEKIEKEQRVRKLLEKINSANTSEDKRRQYIEELGKILGQDVSNMTKKELEELEAQYSKGVSDCTKELFQKIEKDRIIGNILRQMEGETLTEDEKKEIENAYKKYKDIEEIVKKRIGEKIGENEQYSKIVKLLNQTELTEDEKKELENARKKMTPEWFNIISNLEENSFKNRFENVKERQIYHNIELKENYKLKITEKELRNNCTKIIENIPQLDEVGTNVFIPNNLGLKAKSEEKFNIDNLMKKGFNEKEIRNALKQYKEYLNNYSNIPPEVLDSISDATDLEIELNMQDDFNSMKEDGDIDERTYQILKEMSEENFGGNIQKILTDNKAREEFIQELDKQIESLEPEKEEKQPQEEVDMESVKEELSAIPKALVSIDASTQDIAEGMQGYKQLIDNLDTKEIEGKSNEDVLKILAGRVSEIALSGNANLILEMMTQIGFSGLKNSEMKISPILTTVKSEFIQMIDDVSKEEKIEKTRNEMLAKEPIRDAEAEPGMKSFMVDLRVATKERNDLTNQIVSKDEKQDNITGSSDSDATQGSTSSGKISLQNMMNTVQNVRMSEIKNVQDLMVSIVKENTEKVQEQDELVQDEEQDMV